ncbi:MAG: hypothetical protein JJE08_02605 [Proteiniphilum sp.]|nr:hypothetical protein [Proteiniphilum sp.]
MKKIRVILLLLLVAVLSCVDDSSRLTVPYAPVSFRIDLDGPDYLLKIPLSFLAFSEKEKRLPSDRFGFAGLLVVSDATGNAIYAYDLCCPYEDSKVIKVVPGNEGTAVCPSCGSVFVTMFGITDNNGMRGFGSVKSGPATEPLQSYRVVPLQSGRYSIVN